MQCLEIAWIVFAFGQVHQNLYQGCKEVSWLWLFLLRRQRPFCQDHQHRMPGLFRLFLHFFDIRDYLSTVSNLNNRDPQDFPSVSFKPLRKPFKSYFKSFANMADVLNEKHIIKLLCLDLSVHLCRGSVDYFKNPRRFQAKPLSFDCLPTFLTTFWFSIKVHQGVHCSTSS